MVQTGTRSQITLAGKTPLRAPRSPRAAKASKVKAKHGSNDDEVLNAVVGSRVAVQWDDGVYEGTVDSYHKRRRCFHICYDDGDSEWTEIPHKDVTVISSGTNSFAPQSISIVDRLQSRQLKETSEARTVPTAQQPTQREPMTRPGV